MFLKILCHYINEGVIRVDDRETGRMTGIEEDLIAEAAEPRVRPLHKRVLRIAAIAAVLAIVLTALSFCLKKEESYVIEPGVLVVRASPSASNTDIPVDGTVLEDVFWDNSYSSHWKGMPLLLSIQDDLYPGMDITLECSVSDGSMRHDPLPSDKYLVDDLKYSAYLKKYDGYLGDHCFVNNHKKLYWHPWTTVFDEESHSFWYEMDFLGAQAFLDIIIRADCQIVGYAVIEFYADLDRFLPNWGYEKFYARVLKTVSFPKVGGRYQNVSKEYVDSQFQQIHDDAQVG